jgi:hypothetical protein
LQAAAKIAALSNNDFEEIAKCNRKAINYVKKKGGQIKLKPGYNSPVTNPSYLEKFCRGDKKQMQKYISRFTSTAPELIKKSKACTFK